MTMPTTATTATGSERRLEAGWFQRLAWVVLVWGSLGFLVWLPFLYVAIRRRLASDWAAFASFTLYECVVLVWAAVSKNDDADLVLGITVLVTLLTATMLLLFAMFDKRAWATGPSTGLATGPAYGTGQPNPYQQGYPYGQ
ncbi:hypothetical protein ACWCPF_08490 [Streptomyces sp. NPDC001858]